MYVPRHPSLKWFLSSIVSKIESCQDVVKLKRGTRNNDLLLPGKPVPYKSSPWPPGGFLAIKLIVCITKRHAKSVHHDRVQKSDVANINSIHSRKRPLVERQCTSLFSLTIQQEFPLIWNDRLFLPCTFYISDFLWWYCQICMHL